MRSTGTPGSHIAAETARKRVNELVRAGYLQVDGVTVEQGSDRTLYRITTAGERALDSLTNTRWSRAKTTTQATDHAEASA